MIYTNIGIYKYGKEYEITKIENPKEISCLRSTRKNAIKLDDHLKTPDVLYKLINLFYESYYNTDIDTDVFGKEFYYVIGFLTSGIVPLELEFLAVDEILDDVEEILRGEL